MDYSVIMSPPGFPKANTVRRESDGAMIPADPLNVDWQVYQAWLAAGNKLAGSPSAPAQDSTAQT